MSSSKDEMSWLERYWQVLLIVFGIGFAVIMARFSPQSDGAGRPPQQHYEIKAPAQTPAE